MSGSGKEVLVLGAGMVVRPLVPYLTQHGYRVVVASRTLAKAQQIVEGISGAKAVECDVETDAGKATLETLLPSADAVVSLLPYLLHPFLAKRALAHNKHFFTTSYVRYTQPHHAPCPRHLSHLSFFHPGRSSATRFFFFFFFLDDIATCS
jgi:saccharopine dehydrogenase-like NADP-dependent oxidoreductase